MSVLNKIFIGHLNQSVFKSLSSSF